MLKTAQTKFKEIFLSVFLTAIVNSIVLIAVLNTKMTFLQSSITKIEAGIAEHEHRLDVLDASLAQCHGHMENNGYLPPKTYRGQ